MLWDYQSTLMTDRLKNLCVTRVRLIDLAAGVEGGRGKTDLKEAIVCWWCKLGCLGKLIEVFS